MIPPPIAIRRITSSRISRSGLTVLPSTNDASRRARPGRSPNVGFTAMVDELGLSFEEVAEEYDRVRPGYPDELLETALELAGLGPGSPVLEVGPGTGKLTRLLVDRGLAVDAVEPGAEMAVVARR